MHPSLFSTLKKKRKKKKRKEKKKKKKELGRPTPDFLVHSSLFPYLDTPHY